MNEKKICFIICTNDDFFFSECIKYIQRLEVPEGIEIDLMEIRDAISMTAGYNEGMRSSDAKYKVYMHQDVFIRNKYFICDILDLFAKNEGIGLIGLVGSPVLPANGVMWHGKRIFGDEEISSGGCRNCVKENGYWEVEAVDGLLMATQYDVPWREDLFDGWDFYDISQCYEMQRAGYMTVVPAQKEPWFIHDDKEVTNLWNHNKYRQKFLIEYGDEMRAKHICGKEKEINDSEKPLVSVIIPTYNRKGTIKRAIDSVLNQTYKNIELIIVDDCSTDGTQEYLMREYEKIQNIVYVVNDVNLGGNEARNIGVTYSMGEYIAFQDSDDEWMLDKVEKQMNLMLKEKTGMVYSRFLIHCKDGTKKSFPPNALERKDITGDMFRMLLLNPLIGTPTMLMKKNCFENIGGFNKKLSCLQDYEFSIRFSRQYNISLYDEVLVNAYETEGSVGKQNDEKIRTLCYIMKEFREDYKVLGLREYRMSSVYKEAELYGNVHVLEESVEILKEDPVYYDTYSFLAGNTGV